MSSLALYAGIARQPWQRNIDSHAEEGSGFQPAPRTLPVRLLHDEPDLPGHQLGIWFLGVHGGAGESTLAQLFAGTAAADHEWPISPAGQTSVALCARSNFWGMRSVQTAMRDWSANYRRHVHVLGLVLIADRPGRLPRSLSEFQRDLEGATSNLWRLPWVERWSLGEIPSRENAPIKEVEALRLGLTVALRARQERQVSA